LDFSIDQGGCSETSRPTTLRDQTYIVDGVIHHCVPNLTAAVARTTSHGLTNSLIPYLLALGSHGIMGLLDELPYVATGVNLYAGKLSNSEIAHALGRNIEVTLPYGNEGGTVATGGGK